MKSPHQTSAILESATDFRTAPLQTLREELEVPQEGLSQAEAQIRLQKFGYNELPEEKTNPLLKFLSYLCREHLAGSSSQPKIIAIQGLLAPSIFATSWPGVVA